MKLVLKLKLLTDPQTDCLLRQTAQAYQCACNALSQIAFENQTFSAYALHPLAYYRVKAEFELPAQLVIRAIAEVCNSYKSLIAQLEAYNRSCPPDQRRGLELIHFKPNLAVSFDQRVMRLDVQKRRVSLRTLRCRIGFDFQAGEKCQPLLAYAQGQADLRRYGKEWFLLQTLEVPEAELRETTNHLGVDVGICTVASCTDGKQTLRFPGEQIRQMRNHRYQLRRGLQRHNTRSSRRRMRKLRDKESRTVRTFNHLISRRIVSQAQRTNSTIVLEALEGIREGAKVHSSQRRERFSWAYAQLQQFIVYKAKLAGIPVLWVAPDYTSKTCSKCLNMSDRNRPTQAWFKCVNCGFCWHADDNAAENIRFLGAESTRQKRTVCMQEYLHTERRKPLRFNRGS